MIHTKKKSRPDITTSVRLHIHDTDECIKAADTQMFLECQIVRERVTLSGTFTYKDMDKD